MPQTTKADPRARTASEWLRTLAKYREPSPRRSLYELAITVLPLVALWVLAWLALSVSVWLTLLLTIPAAGFLLRLFLIQHDCGHGSFFRHREANDWLGRGIGILTLTPYDIWRRSHATHHATSGNLDKRGIGDIDTLTVREYRALPAWRKIAYRLYRHPIVMFGLGPAWIFLLMNRLPVGYMREGWLYWASAMGTNLAVGLAATGLIYFIGVGPFLIVHLPIVMLAASAGVWLFFVQHQFEDTHWAEEPAWEFHDAALQGSSHYQLPPVLRWFTANIGVHHVHHLYSRIPYYRLPQVLRDFPELREMSRLTMLESLSCTQLCLWDEVRRKLVPLSAAAG